MVPIDSKLTSLGQFLLTVGANSLTCYCSYCAQKGILLGIFSNFIEINFFNT